MFRVALILFVASICLTGCQSYGPEVPAALQKWQAVKVGMTRPEVYAILPEKHSPAGTNTDEWELVSVDGERPRIMTRVYIDVTFGADGRVRMVDHNIYTDPLVVR
jgi:outer membrane protein assembly factor BamE (lipoprotein component of BamABCDE complex)